MEINSLSAGVKATSSNRRNTSSSSQQTVGMRSAVPKNSNFLPHKTFFETQASKLRTVRNNLRASIANPFKALMRYIPNSEKKKEKKNKEKNKITQYCGLSIPYRPEGVLVNYIKQGKLEINIYSFIKKFKLKMLNYRHDSDHMMKFIEGTAMPDLRMYMEKIDDDVFTEHRKTHFLLPKGKKILHQCCLMYIGYILMQLEHKELEDCDDPFDEKKVLSYFSSLLPGDEKAIKLNDKEVVVAQEYLVEFGDRDDSESSYHGCNSKVIFGIQEVTTNKIDPNTSKNKKKLFLTLKSFYPMGNTYLNPLWDKEGTKYENETEIREKLSTMREIFSRSFITTRLRHWYEESNPEMSAGQIKSKIFRELKLEALGLTFNDDIYNFEVVIKELF